MSCQLYVSKILIIFQVREITIVKKREIKFCILFLVDCCIILFNQLRQFFIISMSRMDTWFSKEDVLKDLGMGAGRYEDVEDDFIVRGERPPPPRRIEDDDMNHMFSSSSPPIDSVKAPDLQGISYMLQMVNEYEDKGVEESGTAPDEEVTISKLNPNVPEFIPTTGPKCSPSNKKNVVTNETNQKSSKIETERPTEDVNECNKTKDCKDIDMDKRIDVATLKPEEITDITKKLRSEITQAPNTDNWQGKRKRNVAIAALLKLYSANSATPSPTPTTTSENNVKPVLFTPQYFERCSANAPLEEAVSVSPKVLLENASTPSQDTEKGSSGNLKGDTSSSNETSSPSSSLRSPNESQSSGDPEMRQSIEKVTNWLEKPAATKHVLSPKPKGPVLNLGPISFKKKVNQKSSASPSDDSKRSTPTITTAYHVPQYVPSTYADDLTKMYSERKEALKQKELTKLDIWTRVEMELKAKEEKLKESELEKSRTSNDSQDGSGNESQGIEMSTVA